jgi:hypothetical protein
MTGQNKSFHIPKNVKIESATIAPIACLIIADKKTVSYGFGSDGS